MKKTLDEIKQVYEQMVQEKVEREGISIGHSRWDIKDEVLSDLLEQEFDDEWPEDKEIKNWFEKEIHVVAAHIDTEYF